MAIIENIMERSITTLATLALGVMALLGPGGSAPAQEKKASESTKESAKPPVATKESVFYFGGGTPAAFIQRTADHFHVDWSIASIPRALRDVEVPRIQLAARSPGELLKLYNRLADQNRVLGKWYIEGDEANPSVLMLVGDANVTVGEREKKPLITVVIPIGGLPEPQWEDLERFIEKICQITNASDDQEPGQRQKHHLMIDPRTKSLIANGSQEFVEVVKAAVAALKANAESLAEKNAGALPAAKK
jgi:hypothetical protein